MKNQHVLFRSSHNNCFSFHSCFTETDIKHENEIDLFEAIDENVRKIIFLLRLRLEFIIILILLHVLLEYFYSFYNIFIYLSQHRNPNTNAQTAQCCAFYGKHSQGRYGRG